MTTETNERTYYPLSHKETEMMELFWKAEAPLGREEILERAEKYKQTWKPNSVHILLNQLLDKKYIAVAGYYLNSRKLGRTFEPTITQQEYATLRLQHDSRLAKKAGVSLSRQIAALKEMEKK